MRRQETSQSRKNSDRNELSAREPRMLERIRSGMAHIQAGRLHSNEEAFAKMDRLARAIAKKHG